MCDAILPARIAPVFVSPARQNGVYSGPTAGAIRAERARPAATASDELGGRMGWDLPGTNSALTVVPQQSSTADRAPPAPAATEPEPCEHFAPGTLGQSDAQGLTVGPMPSSAPQPTAQRRALFLFPLCPGQSAGGTLPGERKGPNLCCAGTFSAGGSSTCGSPGFPLRYGSPQPLLSSNKTLLTSWAGLADVRVGRSRG